jgi:flap endonuclease-1
MGVDLGDLAIKHKAQLPDFAGKPIAIDAMNMLYQFLASIRQEDGTPLKDLEGRVTGHLSGLFYRSAKLVSAGVKPVYVFDGKPPKFKEKEIEARQRVKQEAELKWKKALEEEKVEEAKKYAQGTSRLTREMVEESKELLSAMGIPWVQAPSEGEAEAAWMVKEGLCFASASQDYDSLLFGSPVLVRNISISGKRKVPRQNRYVNVEPERIELPEMLKSLGISREQLILVGMMVGTDFNEGIRGVGPKTGMKIVKEHDTLPKVKAHAKEKYDYSFEEYIDEVYEFFLHPPTEEKVGEIKWKEADLGNVEKLLVEKHDFTEERVARTLENMKGVIKEAESQKRLDKWF